MTFRRASYPTGQVYHDECWYRWCFEEAPTAAERPPIWMYEKDGEVLGHQTGIRVELKVGERVVPALWASELMVAKALQLRGIGTVISAACVADEGCVLGFEVSPAARKALVRDGWTDVGDVPYWFRPLDASTIVAARKDSRLGKPPAPCSIWASQTRGYRFAGSAGPVLGFVCFGLGCARERQPGARAAGDRHPARALERPFTIASALTQGGISSDPARRASGRTTDEARQAHATDPFNGSSWLRERGGTALSRRTARERVAPELRPARGVPGAWRVHRSGLVLLSW